jgi:fibronectin-binding autotransporter adhesin
MKYKIPYCLPFLTAVFLPVAGFAADVTWSGGNFTWQNSDSDSFGASTYTNGDNVTFGNAGITNSTSGETAIVLSGTLTPANVTFSHTQSSNLPGGFNYLFTSSGTSNVINSAGALSLGGGNTIFRALTTSGTYNQSFAGALSYNGSTMLGLSSDNSARIVNLSVGSLAAPTKGNTILFNSITSAAGTSSGASWGDSLNRLTVTGAKPAVTNGMVSPGLQFYTGANVVGNFMTFSGDALIPATANYSNYSSDWSGAASTEIVNLTTGITLSGSGALDVHALRVNSGNQNLGGRTINLGSGGFITSNSTTSNGTLNFGSGAAFIGAYNAAGQAQISASISGSGGLTIMGASQTLSVTGTNSSLTGGIYLNGGRTRLTTDGANGNNVTVNSLGRLIAGTSSGGTDRIGGLSGAGAVSSWVATSGTASSGTLEISPASGTHTFSGSFLNGNGSPRPLNLIKSGDGTQIFGDDSVGQHTGTTNVTSGKLVINGNFSTATGDVSVASGAVLGGSGTIGGATAILAGGIHAPGSILGVQNFSGDLTYQDASIFAWEIAKTHSGSQTRGTDYDGVNVTGALAGLDGADDGATTDAIFRIVIGDSDFSDGFWTSSRTWTDIFTEADGTSSKTAWASIFGGGFQYYKTDGTVLDTPTTYGSFSFVNSGTGLHWAAVPEPSSSVLAGLLIITGLMSRRRL